MGEIIAEKISERKYNAGSVLEIGVGQGLLTNVWQKHLHPSKATYIDLLPMPTFGIAPTEEYVVADAEEWLKSSSEKYDVILSASTIQWFADPVGFIKTVKQHLNSGGFAVISTFTKGNLHELDAVRPCPLIYRSVEEYTTIPRIQVESWDRPIQFSSTREMLMHLRRTGVTPRHTPAPISLSSLPKALTHPPIILHWSVY